MEYKCKLASHRRVPELLLPHKGCNLDKARKGERVTSEGDVGVCLYSVGANDRVGTPVYGLWWCKGTADETGNLCPRKPDNLHVMWLAKVPSLEQSVPKDYSTVTELQKAVNLGWLYYHYDWRLHQLDLLR